MPGKEKSKPRNLALIPARSGSKRIPEKNIRNFLGKPIISYSIENALSSGLFAEVMVSTDSPAIAAIAKQYGASVPFFRSKKTSDDFATLADVITEVIKTYNTNGIYFDNVCCLLSTAPLVTSIDIELAYNKLINSDFISVYPIVAFSFPVLRSLVMENDGSLNMKWPEYSKTRSQDIPTFYHDTGTFYWHKVEPWMSGKRYSTGIIKSEIEVQDIDNEQDWFMAEMKYQLLHRKI